MKAEFEYYCPSRRRQKEESKLLQTAVPDSDQNPEAPKTQFTKLSSLSLNTVLLYDWWLVKAKEGKRLAVGGFAPRESLGVRSFCSAAVAKRHDTTTLETVDGITVKLSGFINRSRTQLNGFPLEVCNPFRLGFPYFWEEYGNQYCGQEYPDKGNPSRPNFVQVNMCSSTIQPVSLDDIHVTRIRDLLLFPQGDSGNDEVFRKFSCNIAADETRSDPENVKADWQYKDHDVILDATETRAEEFHSDLTMEMNVLSPSKGVTERSMPASGNTEIRRPHSTAYYVQNGTPSIPSKYKVTPKYKDDDGQFKKSTDFITPSRGVITRSMARLKNLGNKLEENISLQSSTQCNNSASVLSSKTTGIQPRKTETRSDSRGSSVRRSNRLKKRK
ncbi:hypothetical protein Patl1_30244 [Pistacia atlantica]|uniref:Uncharacterized protein n=1 Tax=Pistacia atlantica TaxID=434234 RepID=A0ACC1ABE1_9ROSI|nr:hypothetical protein Patl1_30244 [Pistacia atlantica]